MEKISPWSQSLEAKVSLSRSYALGVFINVGVTQFGKIQFVLLKQPVAEEAFVKLKLDGAIKLVGNCVIYPILSEIGSVVGHMFDCEKSKTTYTPYFIAIKNSIISDKDLYDYVMKKNHEPLFNNIVDSYSTNCLIYVSSHQDACLIAPEFDDDCFKNLDLM